MEDASDATRTPAGGYYWDGEASSAPAGKYWKFSTPNVAKYSQTDANGLVIDVATLAGQEAYITYGGVTFIVTLEGYSDNTSKFIGWSGEQVIVTGGGGITINPVSSAVLAPLAKGDAWVHDGNGFVPKPVVPTLVVTEFPVEPDANTLYIKVV
jgi:hypothetical protein